MAKLRPALVLTGFALALLGLLWVAQGLGYIAWPRSSFMLNQREWADYGAALAVIGLLLVLLARRIRR